MKCLFHFWPRHYVTIVAAMALLLCACADSGVNTAIMRAVKDKIFFIVISLILKSAATIAQVQARFSL